MFQCVSCADWLMTLKLIIHSDCACGNPGGKKAWKQGNERNWATELAVADFESTLFASLPTGVFLGHLCLS